MRLSQVARSSGRTRKIQIMDQTVEYLLVRSKRRKKTIGFKIERGTLEVSAPTRATVREIEAILLGRSEWILCKLEAARSGPEALQFVSGESLPFLGRQVLLRVDEQNVRRPSARLEGEMLLATVPAGREPEERGLLVRSAVEKWYRAQAMDYLQASVERWLPSFGEKGGLPCTGSGAAIEVGQLQFRRHLRFSWRLAMLEPEIIDSVVVHELAHLEVMNHSPDFWEVVLRAMPDARERRRRLNDMGQRLPL